MELTLFLFRRDLRLEDNTALLFALKHSKKVILGFIFTPEQIEQNPYRSNRSLQFMIESLEDLNKQIESKGGKLYLFFGHPEEVVDECINKLHIDSVAVNCDYTPYSIQRDQKIEAMCKKRNVAFHSFHDALLHPPQETVKSDGSPYTIFTPFHRNALRLTVPPPLHNPYTNYYSSSIPFSSNELIYKKILPERLNQQKGGREEALKILKTISSFSNYANLRDFPAEDKTTHLSPHLKFTTCSPREVYYSIEKKLGPDFPLTRSLYWRDFFSSIAFHFPNVFKGPFKSQFNKINWNQDKKKFLLWCEGKTGFPIVDAGMRELNQTGFMHNRARMITGSFLVKDLHIDWRWGEKYFAQNLIDYDPAINNGNWQWVASTGCDAQPYFRIFNPWNQEIKFDPDCVYIKRWVPELRSFSPKIIHSWHLEKHHNTRYLSPIVDHGKESKICLEEYKK